MNQRTYVGSWKQRCKRAFRSRILDLVGGLKEGSCLLCIWASGCEIAEAMKSPVGLLCNFICIGSSKPRRRDRTVENARRPGKGQEESVRGRGKKRKRKRAKDGLDKAAFRAV